MKKLFFVATCPTINTGYSRIAHQLSNYLAKHFQVFYFAYSRTNGDEVERSINKNIIMYDVVQAEREAKLVDAYGEQLFLPVLKQFNPDILFIYNDVVVIPNRLEQLIGQDFKFKIVCYVDTVYEYCRPDIMEMISQYSDILYVFSDCWKKHLISIGLSPENIKVLYHGVDQCFTIQNKMKCRKILKLPLKGFLVLNTNRNSYRKHTDVTLYTFFKFFKPNTYLVLNCSQNEERDYNLFWLFESVSKRLSLPIDVIKEHTIITGKLTDTEMNYLYNACDVGLNTTSGEGFGLCNLEHGSLGVPQVLSGVPTFYDIFPNLSTIVPPVGSYELTKLHGDHYGLVRVFNEDSYAEQLTNIYNDYSKYKEEISLINFEKYNWRLILFKMVRELNEITTTEQKPLFNWCRPIDYGMLRIIIGPVEQKNPIHEKIFKNVLYIKNYKEIPITDKILVISKSNEIVYNRNFDEILSKLRFYPIMRLQTYDFKNLFGFIVAPGHFSKELFSNQKNYPHLIRAGYIFQKQIK